jgi:lipopolysaccharide export system protein LptC
MSEPLPQKDVLGSLLQADHHLDKRLRLSNLNTHFVRILKLALPLVAVGLVVVLLIWSDQSKIAPPVDKKDVVPDQIGQNKLINPQFQSKDEKAQPYNITAKEAVQNPEQPDIVSLIAPKGSMNFNDGTVINIEALHGNFDQKKQVLNLSEAVNLKTNDGYSIDLNSVVIDLVRKTSSSAEAVSAQSMNGIMKADGGFTGDAVSGVLTFKGPAHLTIHNQKMESNTP